jgi:hypothetical protein
MTTGNLKGSRLAAHSSLIKTLINHYTPWDRAGLVMIMVLIWLISLHW